MNANVKAMLLQLLQHVAYTDDGAKGYYDALYAALYGGIITYPGIAAEYAPGSHIVYTDDSLNSLKSYLTVKYYESASSAGVVVPIADCTLSGTLADGVSPVTVSYQGMDTIVFVEAYAETQFFQSVADDSTSEDRTWLRPFIVYSGDYDYDYTRRISSIEAKFKTAGRLTIGYYTSTLNADKALDLDTNYVVCGTVTVPGTGLQKIRLSNPIALPAGASLGFGDENDSMVFIWGGSGRDKGFWASNKNTNKFTNSSTSAIGYNIYTIRG